MALRNARPVRHVPYGVSDCVDATNAPPGAMAALANLIPDPTTHGVYVARPAAVSAFLFAPAGFASPGFVSSMLPIGDLVYGTIATTRNAGKDEPFCYDMAAGAFVPVSGVLATNVPSQPPISGAWTPPILAQVGSRIIVTHPGFPGGPLKFGWFDVSGAAFATTGNTHSSTRIDGNPRILGIQPGLTVTGAGIPIGARVVSTASFSLTTGGDTHSNTTIDNLVSTVGVAIGQTVDGVGIPTGTTVAAIVGPTQITLSQAATATAAGVTISFGGATITLSLPATATANNVGLNLTGGTKAAPLWGAGDTDMNNLPSVPVGVAQYNGRAYFALGPDGIMYSDSGFPCRISNSVATQALTTNDGLAVTAVAPLQLTAPLTGGIVQALIAFEGATKMQQITGDQAIPATSTSIANGGISTLGMNLLPSATGTLAPLSIVPCELGLAFVSPEGLRVVKFDGTVAEPIGEDGKGVVIPFISSVQPSRICAAANRGVLRITTQNGDPADQPYQEYWYDLRRKTWTGPHTSTASLIQPWRQSFLMSFAAVSAQVFQSDSVKSGTSTFVERGLQMAWLYQTPMLPDSGDGHMVAVVEMTLTCELAVATTTAVTATSDFELALDTTTILGDGVLTIWDQFNWDQALWDAQGATFRQRAIDWNQPLVFKQASLQITGTSAFNVRIGNLYGKFQSLGYKLENAA